MDRGTLDGSHFSVFDEAAKTDPVLALKLLASANYKIMAARATADHLRQELQAAEDYYLWTLEDGRPWITAAMGPSITSHLTTIHLLERYALLLTRDCLRLEGCLSGAVNTSHWQAWCTSVLRLNQQTPNVHDHFLWQTSLMDPEEEGGEPLVNLVLRRDAQ